MPGDVNGSSLVEPLINAVKTASYPDVEVAGADLTPAVYSELHNALNRAKRDVEVHVRSLSKEVAPDVDGWIARANQVQHDIQQSKATARGIVEEAEAQKALQCVTNDSAQKVDLLEKELAFSSALEEALEYIQTVASQLARSKALAVENQINEAFQLLQGTRDDLERLQGSYSNNAGRALSSRASSIQEDVIKASRDHISSCIKVSPSQANIDVGGKGAEFGDANLETCIDILRQSGALDPLVQTYQHDLQKAFFDHWLTPSMSHGTARLRTTADRAWLDREQRSGDFTELLADIEKFVGFLSEALPKDLQIPIVGPVFPDFWNQLEQSRLNAIVPVDIERLSGFDDTLTAVSRLSRTLSTTGWPGHDKVQEWIAAAPRVWLSRQREHTLQAVRTSLLSNLRQTKKAEKVETQVVSHEEQVPDENGWDTEWKDEQGAANEAVTKSDTNGDADDASAWDVEDDDNPLSSNGHAAKANEDDDEAAWGWDDGQETSPTKSKSEPGSTVPKSAKGNKGTEVTLRETYTVTSVPDILFDESIKVLLKAKQLSGEQFSSSAIAPGIAGLSNIPTLATALYRAMALTAYDKIDSGKMLLYNDSMRLADLLQSFLDGKAEASAKVELTTTVKRKLEQDINAFERFAKVSYGAEMESQKTILRDLMDGAQGFSNCTTSPYDVECDDAVSMTIDRIRDVYKQWSGILSKSALLQSVGSLLGATTSKFMVDIQELSDIGEEESKKLLSYVKSISSLSDLFVEQHADTGEVRDMTPLYCQNWLKFQYFGEILDANLVDLKYLWSEGELSLEFEAEEITDLIEALFADTDNRRRAIAEIKGGRR
ncbi:hypothetical protein B9Z65_2561 [Elsinoe australis]|uniref:ZW10 C-terminal helical domain-containing protein n=1 Tax=Elsinoe australis TaxID=40998 RepID=A0A2P8A3X9_9PEZI|nr:hypothetical protein B9Z65_2561 [Elsinoe australis]